MVAKPIPINLKHIGFLRRRGVKGWNIERECEYGKLPECDPDRYWEWGERLPVLDLEGVNFHDVDLRRVRFNEENLVGANFRNCWLCYVDFVGADLTGADLRKATLNRAILRQAKLRHAKLDGVELNDCDFRGAVISKADFSDSDLKNANLNWAEVVGVTFKRSNLRNADFSHATFRGWWASAPWSHTSMVDADVSGAVFVGCDLSPVDFDNALVAGTFFSELKRFPRVPKRLRLGDGQHQLLTGQPAADFFRRPCVEIKIPRSSLDGPNQKVLDEWVSTYHRREVRPGFVLIGRYSAGDDDILQFQGPSLSEFETFRPNLIRHFTPLERDDWDAWSDALSPKERLEAIAAMMRDEQTTPERAKELEKLLAQELPKSSTIKGDAPATPVVQHHYYVSKGGKVIVGEDHSPSTTVRDSVIDGSALGQGNRTFIDRKESR
jgi:uncharacterized protein YjbI with pentapeptide repeats